MANTYTPNLQLAMPAPGDRTWNVPVNGNAQVFDALAPVSAFAVVTAEVPSATLNVRVAAGNYLAQDGTIGTYRRGSTSQTMTASATNYLYLDLDNSAFWWPTRAAFPRRPTSAWQPCVAGASTSRVSPMRESRFRSSAHSPMASTCPLARRPAPRLAPPPTRSSRSSAIRRSFSPFWGRPPPEQAIRVTSRRCSTPSTTPSEPSGWDLDRDSITGRHRTACCLRDRERREGEETSTRAGSRQLSRFPSSSPLSFSLVVLGVSSVLAFNESCPSQSGEFLAGSFDYNPYPPQLALDATPIGVFLYDSGADDGEGYSLLPNVRCDQIQYKEGIEPPVARFSYILDEVGREQ